MSCFSCNDKLQLTDTLICSQCSRAYHYSCCDLPEEEFKKLFRNDKEWSCSNCKSNKQTLSRITKDDLKVLEKAIVASICASFDDTNARITKLQSHLVDCIRHNDELFLKVRAMQNDLNSLKLKVESIGEVRLSPAGSRRSSGASDAESKKRNWYYAVIPIIYKLRDTKLVRRIMKDLPKLCLVAIQWIFPGAKESLQTKRHPAIRCKRFAAIKPTTPES